MTCAVTLCRLRWLAAGNQRGQALVELGIIIVLFVLLTMGLIEFGRTWMVANMITHATRDGARAAAVSTSRDGSGNITNGSTIRDQVRNEIGNVLDASTVSGLGVTVDQPTIGGIPMARVSVTGSVPYIFNLPFAGTSFTVNRTVIFRDEGR